VQRAEVIAIGTVTGIREQWDTTRQAPFTLVTFSNLTVLKGNPGTEVTLYFLGGHTPEGKVLEIAGMPHFTVGEKNVVFCAGNQRDVIPLVGLWQGLLRVAFDPQRGTEIISDHSGVPIMGVQDGAFVSEAHPGATQLTPGAPEPEPLSLSTLQQLIQQELRSPYGQQ